MIVADDSGHRTIRRRALLASVAVGSAVVVVGCTNNSSRPGPTQSGPSGSGLPSDDDGVRARRAATESSLVAAYDQAIATAAGGVEELRAFRDHHLAHLIAIDPTRDPALATVPPFGSPSSGSPALRSPALRSPAPSTASPQAQLQKLETQAAAAATDLCEVAANPELVMLLSQIGACEAAHASLLGSASARAT